MNHETSHPVVACPTLEAAALVESPYFEDAYFAAQITGKKHFHLATRGIIQWRLKMYLQASGHELDAPRIALAVTWACSTNLTFGDPVREMDGQQFADMVKDVWYEGARLRVKRMVDEPHD